MFDINGGEFLVIAMLALLVLGPDRLPDLARQVAGLIRRARQFATGARQQMRDELGPEFDQVDWRRYDIRQYHPRRIVQNALSDITDDDEPVQRPPRRPGTGAAARRATSPAAGAAGVAGAAAGAAAGAGGAGVTARGADRAGGAAGRAGGATRTGARAGQRSRPGDATPRPASPPPTTWAAAADRAGLGRDASR